MKANLLIPIDPNNLDFPEGTPVLEVNPQSEPGSGVSRAFKTVVK